MNIAAGGSDLEDVACAVTIGVGLSVPISVRIVSPTVDHIVLSRAVLSDQTA